MKRLIDEILNDILMGTTVLNYYIYSVYFASHTLATLKAFRVCASMEFPVLVLIKVTLLEGMVHTVWTDKYIYLCVCKFRAIKSVESMLCMRKKTI